MEVALELLHKLLSSLGLLFFQRLPSFKFVVVGTSFLIKRWRPFGESESWAERRAGTGRASRRVAFEIKMERCLRLLG